MGCLEQNSPYLREIFVVYVTLFLISAKSTTLRLVLLPRLFLLKPLHQFQILNNLRQNTFKDQVLEVSRGGFNYPFGCKRRSRLVQSSQDKIDTPPITFHSFFSPFLSIDNAFFLRSINLYDSDLRFMTKQWSSILSRKAEAITRSPRTSSSSLIDLLLMYMWDYILPLLFGRL